MSAVWADAASFERQITSFTLPNGMQWIVLERPGSGHVVSNLYTDVGAVYEDRGRTGVSQLIATYVKLAARAAGWGTVRSVVSHDHQCFVNTVPPAQLADWLRFEARRLTKQVFPAVMDDVKRSQISELTKRSANGAWILEELQRVAFLMHPYGQPRWGFISDVDQLTQADAEDFYTTYYVPANTIAVIVGDITAAQIRPLAEQLFGGIPPGRKAPPLGVIEPQQRAVRRILAPPEQAGAIAVAYHKGAVGEDTYPVWDVLIPAINNKLKAELIQKQGWASRIDAHLAPAMKYKGLVLILAFLKPTADPAEVELAIEAELRGLGRTVLTPEEFAAAMKAFASPAGNLSDEATAQELGDWQAMTGDYRNMFRHRARVQATTPEQVRSLAAETFRPYGRTVGIVPASARP